MVVIQCTGNRACKGRRTIWAHSHASDRACPLPSVHGRAYPVTRPCSSCCLPLYLLWLLQLHQTSILCGISLFKPSSLGILAKIPEKQEISPVSAIWIEKDKFTLFFAKIKHEVIREEGHNQAENSVKMEVYQMASRKSLYSYIQSALFHQDPSTVKTLKTLKPSQDGSMDY